jgi:hypothetical protein
MNDNALSNGLYVFKQKAFDFLMTHFKLRTRLVNISFKIVVRAGFVIGLFKHIVSGIFKSRFIKIVKNIKLVKIANM